VSSVSCYDYILRVNDSDTHSQPQATLSLVSGSAVE
jgi:hypothetical protein